MAGSNLAGSNYAQAAVDAMTAAHPGNPPELTDLYALLVLIKGEGVTLKDVHDAWAIWRARTRPDHPDLVPFEQVSSEVQEYDRPYRDSIAAAGRTAKAAA